MINLVQLIIAFTLVALLAPGNADGVVSDPWLAVGALAATFVGYFFLVRVITKHFINEQARATEVCDQLWLSGHPNAMTLAAELRARAKSGATQLSHYFQIGSLVIFATLIGASEAPDLVAALGVQEMILATLCLMLLWLGLLAINAYGDALLMRHAHRRSVKIPKHIIFTVLLTAAGALPLALMVGLRVLLAWIFPALPFVLNAFDFADGAMMLGLIVLIFWVLPLVLRLVLPTRPISATTMGPRIAALAKRTQAPVDKILVLRTRPGGLSTAFLIGVAWPFRYVFITQALMEALNEEEVEAVVAHEFGHGKRWHLPLLLGFMATLLLVEYAIAFYMSDLPPGFSSRGIEQSAGWLADVLPIALIAGFLLGFGYLSRRCEREADMFAAKHCGPSAIQSALRTLARTAGIDPNKQGWRHFSINRRIAELQESRPAVLVPRRSWRLEKRIAVGLIALLAFGSMAFLWDYVKHDYLTGVGTFHAQRAEYFESVGDMSAARAQHQAALASMQAYLLRSDAPEIVATSVRIQAGFEEILAQGTTSIIDAEIAGFEARGVSAEFLKGIRSLYLRAFNEHRPLHKVYQEEAEAEAAR